jgi:hypothetical protein
VRRSPTERKIASLASPTLILASLALAACDPVDFDFGGDADAGGSGGTCDAIDPIVLACAGDADSGCFGEGEVTAAAIGESAGCTPAGMALGAARLEIPESGAFDLFAWAGSVPWIDSVFDDAVSLAVFPDACGAHSFGGDLECDYRPWILKTALPASEVYIHAQTSAGGDALDRTAAIGFQIMPSGAWDEALPPASQAMECDAVPNGPLDEALLYPDPLTGAPRPIRFSGKSPASLSGLTGAPRICGASAAGWRQAGYLIENTGDPPPAHLTGVHVRTSGAETGPSVSFHFGLFACAAGSDQIEADQLALASSCDDSGDHPSKQTDVDIALWDPEDSSTKYVLVLQIPPGEGTSFFLQLDVD